MTKKEFKELTGEDPEDVLGGDYQNEMEINEPACEICGIEYLKEEDEEMINLNFLNIKKTNRCTNCFCEYGATKFADQ